MPLPNIARFLTLLSQDPNIFTSLSVYMCGHSIQTHLIVQVRCELSVFELSSTFYLRVGLLRILTETVGAASIFDIVACTICSNLSSPRILHNKCILLGIYIITL